MVEDGWNIIVVIMVIRRITLLHARMNCSVFNSNGANPIPYFIFSKSVEDSSQVEGLQLPGSDFCTSSEVGGHGLSWRTTLG